MPIKSHVSSGLAYDPQITLGALSVSRIKVINRRFIHLHVAAIHDGGFDLLVDHSPPPSLGKERTENLLLRCYVKSGNSLQSLKKNQRKSFSHEGCSIKSIRESHREATAYAT